MFSCSLLENKMNKNKSNEKYLIMISLAKIRLKVKINMRPGVPLGSLNEETVLWFVRS